MECFGSFRGEECKGCKFVELCERASRKGRCDEGYDWKALECKVCKGIFMDRYEECVRGSGRKKTVEFSIEVMEKDGKQVLRRKGLREWMDRVLEEGIYVDEWNRLMREKWKRYWSIWEHVRDRKERWGWDVEVKKEGKRTFVRWRKEG